VSRFSPEMKAQDLDLMLKTFVLCRERWGKSVQATAAAPAADIT